MIRKTCCLIVFGFGATSASAQNVERYLDQTKSEILSCAGQPDDIMQSNGFEYFHYKGAIRTDMLPAYSANLVPGEMCETIVILRENRAVGLEWRKPSDLLRSQLCTTPVSRCIEY